MKATSSIWPVLAIVAGGLILRQKQTSGVGGGFSPNKKLDSLLTSIRDSIIYNLGDGDRERAMRQLRRYVSDFPNEPDYNIAQWGNLLVYHYDVREAYKRAGYGSTIDKMSDHKLWDTYVRQVGYVVREMLAGRA